MKTHAVRAAVLIGLAAAVCGGSLKLGFGIFSDPGPGFMPLLAAALLGLLSVADLALIACGRSAGTKSDGEIWANIHWPRLLTTLLALFAFAVLLPFLGFSISTLLLLLLLLRQVEPRPWPQVVLYALGITGASYALFVVALGAQLPAGVLGF
ncbi:MAG: tripartite tricarboxylate transporter TctB family protein [Deltaproteobacteria bacterium]|nr:tripartite tricarboxylate transporter TctB family protein [Deltaproteobacteria bacterium]